MNDSTAARLVVSFCIPIYNNAQGAVKIVNALLSSGDSRFELGRGEWLYFQGGFVTDKAKVKSTVEHGIDINATYFAPPRWTKQFLELVTMIDEKCPQVFTCY